VAVPGSSGAWPAPHPRAVGFFSPLKSDIARAKTVCKPDVPLCARLLKSVEDSIAASRIERQLVETTNNPESVVRVLVRAVVEERVV
jgi:hypothetical protein